MSAWRERRRLAAGPAGTVSGLADAGNPVTMAKVTGAELLRLLHAEADRIADIAARLAEAVNTVTDPTAAEAEVEAVRAAAEQRAAAAEARADADARIAAAGRERDAAIAQARADASTRVSAAEEARDQALAQAAEADRAAGRAQQEAARAQAAAEAAQAETGRVRADTDKMLAGLRAEAVRDRDELRADLRARAERAEREADAYREELTRLRAQAGHDTGNPSASRTPTLRHPGLQPSRSHPGSTPPA